VVAIRAVATGSRKRQEKWQQRVTVATRGELAGASPDTGRSMLSSAREIARRRAGLQIYYILCCDGYGPPRIVGCERDGKRFLMHRGGCEKRESKQASAEAGRHNARSLHRLSTGLSTASAVDRRRIALPDPHVQTRR
jgi:hypothetical protein